MWCPACRADVAAELSLDSRHFRCARCSTELGTAVGALGAGLPPLNQPTDAERNARELLARWNAQNLLETPPSPRALSTADPDNLPQTTSIVSEDVAKPAGVNAIPAEEQPRRRRKKRRIDTAAEDKPVQQNLNSLSSSLRQPKTGNWGVAVGQSCAYFGIGLITCGTALVLWGYFGGPANVAPTGWLITTVGQMFLFLGVVTLVSSGMEQTSAEIAARIDVLGERLIRIERRHRPEELSGPHGRLKQRGRRRSSASDTDDFSAEPV